MKIQTNGITIEYEDTGASGGQADRPAVLLIMGLGMQLIAWPDAFVDALVDAGFRVLRHDNRDCGMSDGFGHAPQRHLLWETLRARLGLRIRSPYTVQDMAEDALGLLSALGIARAHVIGASMGGMIAQRMAATAPQAVISLTSIMSSSGARGLPGPRREVLQGLWRLSGQHGEAGLLAQSLGVNRLVASPAFPQDEATLRERILLGLRRGYRPDGLVRQILAVGADTERAALLSRIACPTLVLHGEADPLLPIECGRDTARRIPGARFVAFPGMGHDLPPGVVTLLLGEIIPFLQRKNGN